MKDQAAVSIWYRLASWAKLHRLDIVYVTILLIVASLAHGWNMFGFPYYENDEATYIQQAWSIVTQGKLAPYTYWYDHAPGGWILLSAWQVVTGGARWFGTLFADGRTSMLVLHALSSILVYFITVKLSRSRLAAVLAVLIFSLSPLALYFQRRVLLDNIMTFWLLAATALLLLRYRLQWVIISGLCFGIAVMSKEPAVVAAPALLYLIFLQSRGHRKWAISLWLAAGAGIVIPYLLYASLKGELFPSGTWLGGMQPHVSLLGSLSTQSGRGAFHWPWDPQSAFFLNASEWIWRDAVITVGGVIALGAMFALGIRRRLYWVIVIMAVGFIVFFARGKLLINFYVVPLVPLLAMGLGIVAAWLVKTLRWRPLKLIGGGLAIAAVVIWYPLHNHSTWTRNETSNQFAAINWVKDNLPTSAVIAIDDYAFPSLHQEAGYTNADWFYKIERDPEIQRKYSENWRNIEYIVLSHDILQGIRNYEAPYLKSALNHSVKVADFTKDTISFLDIKKYISTYGDWAQVYKVKSREGVITQDNYSYLRGYSFKSYGQMIEKPGDATTALALQAAMMQRAAAENQSGDFDGLASWSADQLQHRPDDRLLSASYTAGAAGTAGSVVSAPDVAANVAYADALLTGAKQFEKPVYAERAREIIAALWARNVKAIAGRPQLTLDDGSVTPGLINPAALKAFAATDPTHPWTDVVAAQYAALAGWQAASPAGLVAADASLTAAGRSLPGATATGRATSDLAAAVVRDAIATRDTRASAFLAPLAKFWDTQTTFYDTYQLSGVPTSQAVSPYMTAAAVQTYIATGNARAAKLYQASPVFAYNGDKYNYTALSDTSWQLSVATLLTSADSLSAPVVSRK